ncbi:MULTISPECIES: 50S ribosomal protein L31e [Halomicrobium]|uniref:Large ribosomal subunit protein eL31 n=2 Tax=Halomicrobium mukohataei TaxID=57705 RepID=C7P2N3_HALMD|nr:MULTISPECIES: 50S ribosomal protein L31e [Halomicrobium]ACV47355.1 Ribosomal protein L31e [Halomicrobium mukohataei DSM 12286]QCD65823.1 50S ribosomal protein L31e [Halomicrobium mukohataei]QFR20628.1 50S ribosomal protein L31e [Halomicrobium sp. ZPS1]
MSANDFEERVVTVPLRDADAEANHKKADKAMSIVREHLAKHFAVDEDAVRLDPSINEAIWERGRSNPPSKLRVRAARFDEEGENVVEAETAE